MSHRISPTAHYTGWIWCRNGLSDPALASSLGRLLYLAVAPADALHERFGRGTGLETLLLARHRALDHLLETEVRAGRVQQVVEVAAGLSPRGLRFARAHPDLRYVEADLAPMAAQKQRRLEAAGLDLPNLESVPIDALADTGPESLDALAQRLDPGRGTGVVTEGLLPYFDRPAVEGIWRRVTRFLGRFPHGVYLSDLYTEADLGGLRAARTFRHLLSAFARGRVTFPYGQIEEAVDALREAGFGEASVRQPTEVGAPDIPRPDRQHLVRVVRAVV